MTLEGAKAAMIQNDTLFRGRQITVFPKRKNIPSHHISGGSHQKQGSSFPFNINGSGKRGTPNQLMQMASLLSIAMLGAGRFMGGRSDVTDAHKGHHHHNVRGGHASADYKSHGGYKRSARPAYH